MPLIDHFGMIAPIYELDFPPKENGKLTRLIDLPVSGALLDAGGGTGRIAQLRRGSAGQIVVADLSTKMLQRACRKQGLKGRFCQISRRDRESSPDAQPFPIANPNCSPL